MLKKIFAGAVFRLKNASFAVSSLLILIFNFTFSSAPTWAAGAICDPNKNLYKIESVSSSYDPFLGDSFFTYKISAVAGAKNISNYVISTPVCKQIKSFTSNTPLAASCVTNEKFSGLTGFKIDTPINAPGSQTITIEMNGSFTSGAGNWAVKAGTCPDSKGSLTSVPIAKVSTGTLKFKENNVTVSETADKVLVTVSRVGGSDGTLTVNYSTSDVTAVAGTNYTAVFGTLTWVSGDTSDKIIAIPITNTKTFYEAAKTFTVILKTPDNKYTVNNTVSITSNPKITVENTRYVVSSQAKEVSVTFVRTAGVDPAETVSVTMNTKDITAVAATDYVAVVNKTVTLNPGETVTAVPVTMLSAPQSQNDKLFAVVITDLEQREAATTVTIRGTATPANVAVTTPSDGQTLTAVTTITMTAQPAVTPKRYKVVVQGEVVAYKDTSDNSVDLTWDTTTVVDGIYTLAGRVFYDDSGGQATVEESDPITVVVANNQAAAILSPKDGATVSGLVPVKFSVTAQSVSAELYIDNQLRVGPVAIPANSATATLDYDSTADANGVHTLMVKVTDSSNQVTSDSITVNVANSYADINVTGPQDFTAAPGVQVAYVFHVINAGPDDTVVTFSHSVLANSSVDNVFSSIPNVCQWDQATITCNFPLPGPKPNAINFADITVVKTYGSGNYKEQANVTGTGIDLNPNDNVAFFNLTIQ